MNYRLHMRKKYIDKKEKHRFYVKVKDTRVSFGSVKMKPNRCEFISKEYGVKAGKNLSSFFIWDGNRPFLSLA